MAARTFAPRATPLPTRLQARLLFVVIYAYHLPSRQSVKKYILANNKTNAATPAVFDNQFNKALRTGVEKGEFAQPKG